MNTLSLLAIISSVVSIISGVYAIFRGRYKWFGVIFIIITSMLAISLSLSRNTVQKQQAEIAEMSEPIRKLEQFNNNYKNVNLDIESKEDYTMKFVCPLIVVKDMESSKLFYKNVLRQKVTLDFGGNVTLEGLALQIDYPDLVGISDLQIKHKSNDHELYFEEEDFDEFLSHLAQFKDIVYLHKEKEYPWGQRVVRFYDPDGHIIEVGESMESIFKRLHNEGMNAEQIAERTMHPIDFVKKYIK